MKVTVPKKGVGRPDPVAFGRSLTTGLGVNLLVRDIEPVVIFLADILSVQTAYFDDDFALCHGHGAVFMLHHDRTYRNHSFLSSIQGLDYRGGGVELRLYGCDPDHACDAARQAGATILEPPANKPHGVREAFILGPDGYIWVPTIPDMPTGGCDHG